MPDKQSLCGDGKKKGSGCKNNSNVIDLSQYRRWRRGQHLRRSLAEFADSEIFTEEIDIAREIYFSVLDPDLVDEKDDFLMERFFEWFIFDYRIRGKSILDYFGMTGGLARDEKVLLEKWKRARSSVYQVLQLGNEYEITLRDVIRNKDMKVRDRQAACEIEPGHMLYIRVLPLGEENEFSTGGLILPGYFESYLLNRVKIDAEVFWSKRNRRGSWDIYLRDRAHMLNAMVMEMGTLWELPEERSDPKIKPDSQEIADDVEPGRQPNNVLDYFYDRWINEPMDLLMGKTPLEAYKTKPGREKLQKLLLKLEKVGDVGSQPSMDLSVLWKRLSSEQEHSDTGGKKNISDINTGDGDVAALISDGLQRMGYQSQQVNNAVDMWRQYQDLASPTFRKPGAWAAAVIYALARSQGNDGVNQNLLAQMFNVSATTISNNYSSIRRTLQLDGK
ncbi:MAG TPA: hypothetical protein DEF34_13295 [Desulfotomaculum sp.]|nr:MAG: hypothetical protein JL56_15545 [Desulfotomaculum sp. BICA1-6]HBX24587.1 hypothetical protein [Desulfotomaculum sp.]